MLDYLMTPFHYQYMVKAILVSGFIGGVCAFLSCFLVLRGWALMGDALSHAIVPGVVVAYLARIPFAIGAFVSGILASMTMGLIKSKTRLREDAVIGLVFTTFFALALLLKALFPSPLRLNTIILGNILGIANEDIIQLLIVSFVPLLIILLKWKDLLLYLFDPNHARAIGLSPPLLQAVLLMLLSATTIAALQAVGVCLVVAMLVTPGATAYLLTDRFPKMMIIASVIGVLTSMIGAYVSYFINGSTGGCIVVFQAVIFLAALFLAPKHGIFANGFRARALASAASPGASATP